MSRYLPLSQLLRNSKKALEGAKYKHMMALLDKFARWLLRDCYEQRKGWLGFTGNLPTSYAAGIYYKKKLQRMIFIGEEVDDWSRPIKRSKLEYRESKYLLEGVETYETNPGKKGRFRIGYVHLHAKTGKELSEMFLKSYRPINNDGDFDMVICTGAEYSEFLEDEFGLDVLTGAFNNAETVIHDCVAGEDIEKYFAPKKVDNYDVLGDLQTTDYVPF